MKLSPNQRDGYRLSTGWQPFSAQSRRLDKKRETRDVTKWRARTRETRASSARVNELSSWDLTPAMKSDAAIPSATIDDVDGGGDSGRAREAKKKKKEEGSAPF